MTDIIERFKKRDAEDQLKDSEKRDKADEETAKAVEKRKASMETSAQSKKRKGEQEQKKCKRSTSTETVAYLREKAELDSSLKREELQLRKAELDVKKNPTRKSHDTAGESHKDVIRKHQKPKNTAGPAPATNASAEPCFAIFTAGCSQAKGCLEAFLTVKLL